MKRVTIKAKEGFFKEENLNLFPIYFEIYEVKCVKQYFVKKTKILFHLEQYLSTNGRDVCANVFNEKLFNVCPLKIDT